MSASSKGAVLKALLGNSALACVKFVAFAFSGSGAMLSEAIHSVADSANQALLYLGISRSERPADALFHYGYGADRYLYSLLSAMGIFVLGCGVTVYHGVHSLFDPPQLSLSWLTFAVLAVSFIVEAYVLMAALKAVNATRGKRGLFEYLRTTSDPTVAAVLLEDFIACCGVLVAAGCILLSFYTGNQVWDAVGAITIGFMLGGVAIWLGIKNRTLLLGPAMPQEVHEEVLAFLRAQPSVGEIRDARSRVVGADRFRFQAQLDFDGRYLGRQISTLVRERAGQLTDESAQTEFAEDFGERMIDELAVEIDRIERELGERFPAIKFIDLEAD